MDWPLTISAGIEVNLGFGPTNALSTDNPCCKELSLVSPVKQLRADDYRVFRSFYVSPGGTCRSWAVFEHVSHGTLCFDTEEKALTFLYYLDCLGVYFCKAKHQLHITTWKHTVCPQMHPHSLQHQRGELASK